MAIGVLVLFYLALLRGFSSGGEEKMKESLNILGKYQKEENFTSIGNIPEVFRKVKEGKANVNSSILLKCNKEIHLNWNSDKRRATIAQNYRFEKGPYGNLNLLLK